MGLSGRSSNDWNKIGTKQFDNEQYAEALISFTKAIENNYDDHIIWDNKAKCFFKLAKNPFDVEQYNNAYACIENALELNPNFISALITKTAILNALQSYSKSLFVSDKLIKLKHENIDLSIIWSNRSESFEHLNRLDEAISCIDKAIKYDPDSSDGVYHGRKELLLQEKNASQVQEPQQDPEHYPEHYPEQDQQQDQQQDQESTFDGVLQESDITNNFSRLSWQNAEDLVGKLFEKKDYHSTVSQRTGDFGIDVEAKSTDDYLGIQVKHWSTDVGFEDVAKTLGVSSKFNKVIIVSTKTGFTSQAIEFSQRDENRYRLELWDSNRFKQELRQHVIGK